MSHQNAGVSNICDRCGARAINLITLINTASQLWLCQHHTNEHEPALRGKALIEPIVGIDAYSGKY
jgi:hypothetical protein